MADTQLDPNDIAESQEAPDGRDASNGADRRVHARFGPDKTPFEARLASGAQVRLIDLSRSGAQFECDRRFLPNASVSLRLVASDDTITISGRVVRSRIVRLVTGGLGYVVAVAFNDLLPTSVEPAIAPSVTRRDERLAPQQVDTTRDVPVYVEPELPASAFSDISAEEALAFESTFEMSPAMMTLTATVDVTSDQLRDMFNGNNW